MRYTTVAAAAACCLLLGACALFQPPDITKSLEEVVDAVQYAVEEAGRENVWKASAEEIKHWGAACSLAKQDSAKACLSMFNAANQACQDTCRAGQCSPVQAERCRRYFEGLEQTALCQAGGPAAWCKEAAACNTAKEATAKQCAAAASLALPALKEAKLSLAVAETQQAGGTITILLVTFGQTSSRVATNTIDLSLAPRIRESDYGSGKLPEMPGNKLISDEAKKLASNLKELIRQAVQASVKEYEEKQAGQPAARPPLALASLDIGFSLVIDQNGKLGLKTSWASPSAALDIGVGSGTKSTNTLKISYARPTN